MITSTPYNQEFFANLQDSAQRSALVIVPWCMELVAPHSVVDVGCGIGAWLDVFRQHGVGDFLGIDGDWVPKDGLRLSADHFRAWNLHEPYVSDRTFDLALSLEVAEHLPEKYADGFVRSLTALAPVVLFGAAAPAQGGIGHLNEQWPSFWIKLFADRGYVAFDCLRGRFWDNSEVAPWYAQNTFIFVRESSVSAYPKIIQATQEFSLNCRAVIHPRQYFRKIGELTDPRTYSLRLAAAHAPFLIRRAFSSRLRRFWMNNSESPKRVPR